MKKHVGFLRLTGLLLCLCVFLSACGRKESGSLDGYLFKPKQPVNLSEVRVKGDTLENESFKLELMNNYSEVRLTDKATGDVWSSSMNDPNFDPSKVSGKWKNRIQSMFTLNVTNLKTGVGVVVNYDEAGTDYTATPYATKSGIGVTYDMKLAGIRFNLEFTLTDNGFSIRIPADSVEEYGGTFSIVSIDLLQFFAGATDGQEGYLFYPDGSGAILRFDDMSHLGEASVIYNVYGDIRSDRNLKGTFEQSQADVLLPVFGANYGERGFVAYITSGEESSNITVSPSTRVVSINSVYPSFIFRRGFDDPRVTTSKVVKYDDDMLKTDYEVHYEILPHGHAQYSDMARAYRDYLMSTDQIGKRPESSVPTLSVDVFMGIKEEGLIFDTFRSVTTFSQARDIMADLKHSVDLDLDVSLLGWTKGGYRTEPKYFPANSKLGGNSGLKELAQFASQNGIGLNLAANFMTADAQAGGYSQTTDIVFLGNYQVLTDLRNTVRVISPDAAYRNFSKFMEKATDYPLSGLKLENLGSMLYYSYGSRNMTLASECRAYWQKIMAETKSSLGSVTSEGGNLYTLAYADKVTDIPAEDAGYQMTTEEVPFYQIVVHGLVDYTGEAYNLSSDSGRLLLKWIEYGYEPYFELTSESAEKLINTEYNELYSSMYTDWKQEIIDACGQIEAALGKVQDAMIVSHDRLAEGLYRVTYDNGVRVYVNYNSEPAKADGVSVGAQGWEVVQ